ncbi:hypothetical protein Tco_1018454 [Tanacetum coccineum]|uniref:UBN2 domain-containing protein n=1 Tax=Tanacetum coccineum TaxID=301880 RepID=A0ABQ5FUW3_9ASTR
MVWLTIYVFLMIPSILEAIFTDVHTVFPCSTFILAHIKEAYTPNTTKFKIKHQRASVTSSAWLNDDSDLEVDDPTIPWTFVTGFASLRGLDVDCPAINTYLNRGIPRFTYMILERDESIDSAFARFNIIITSIKVLDEGYSSKNYVKKFLRAIHPKWRAKVMAIEDEMIIKKDSEIVKAKGERKSLALKATKEFSD